MADEKKVVLLEIDINVESAIEAQKELGAEIVKLKGKSKELAETEGTLSNAYLENAAQLKATQAELRKQETLTRKVIESNNSATGSIDQMSAQLSVVNAQWKALSEEERNNSDRGKELSAQKKQLTEAINAEKLALSDTTSNIGNYESATKSLKLELRENTLALVKMKAAGEDNTEAYKQLLRTTGELADTIADTREEVKKYASDTMALDQAIGVMKGIGAAAQVAEGATALLGAENEDLTKSIQKMVAIQSVMSGVQEIGNALQKESAFMMGVMSVKTGIASAAQLVYTTAVGTSTGAMKAFRIALLATGIGALVVGIGLLVANWDKLSSAIGLTTDSTKAYSKSVDGTIIVDEELRKEHNEHIKTLNALGIEYDLVSGKITDYEASVRSLANEYAEQLIEIQNSTSKSLSEVGGFWSTVSSFALNYFKNFGNKSKAFNDVLKEQVAEAEKIKKEGENRAIKLSEEISAKRKVLDAKEAARIFDETKKANEKLNEEEKKRAAEVRKIQNEWTLEEIEALTDKNDDIKAELDSLNEYQQRLSEEAATKELESIQKVIDRRKEADSINADINRTDLEKLTADYEAKKKLLEEFGYSTVELERQFADAKEQIAWKEKAAKLQAYGDVGNALSALGDLAGEKTAEGKALAVAGATMNAYSGIAATLGAPTTIPEPFGTISKIANSVTIGAAAFKAVKSILAVKIPGGKGGGGGGSLSGGSGTTSVPRASYNPEIGKGLVSRSNATGTQSSVASGVQQGINASPVQPVVVVDSVTEKQNAMRKNLKIATY